MKGARGMRVALWILLVIALLATCWAGNLALFNWWAAGGPPTPDPALYEQRGNLFFAATVVLIAASCFLIYSLRRLGRSGYSEEPRGD